MFISKPAEKAPKSDNELLEEYGSAEDLSVLGILFERYFHLVYGVSLKYLKNREESKDAVMNVFEKLVTDLKQHEIRNFKSWLHVATKNYCLMKLRSPKHAQENNSVEINSEQSVEFEVSAHHEDKAVNLILEKDLELLDQCIEQLNEAQRISVRLFFIENKCYQEIAETTGYKMGKVKSYIQNGKRNLKICIEKNRERV